MLMCINFEADSNSWPICLDSAKPDLCRLPLRSSLSVGSKVAHWYSLHPKETVILSHFIFIVGLPEMWADRPQLGRYWVSHIPQALPVIINTQQNSKCFFLRFFHIFIYC
jgi:hypothetical protein